MSLRIPAPDAAELESRRKSDGPKSKAKPLLFTVRILQSPNAAVFGLRQAPVLEQRWKSRPVVFRVRPEFVEFAVNLLVKPHGCVQFTAELQPLPTLSFGLFSRTLPVPLALLPGACDL